MLLARTVSIILSLMLSINAWAINLREGDIYHGTIHSGKTKGQSCQIRVLMIDNSKGIYNLLMYNNNILDGKSFNARQYETQMTAIGSSRSVRTEQGKYITKFNEHENLHVDLKNQVISGATIYNQAKELPEVVINCINMKFLRRANSQVLSLKLGHSQAPRN